MDGTSAYGRVVRHPAETQTDKAPESTPAEQPAPPKQSNEGLFAKPVVGRNWIAVPMTTELQRNAREGYSDAKVFVVINGARLFNDNDTELDVDAIDLGALGKLLESLLVGGMRGTVVMRVEMPKLSDLNFDDPSASLVFHEFLRHFGERWFNRAIVEYVGRARPEGNLDFPALIDLLATPSQDVTEPGVGNDMVTFYPVRTPLSGYLFGMDADNTNCVAHWLIPENDVPASVVGELKKYVDQLGLERKNSVRFLVGNRNNKTPNEIRFLVGKEIGIQATYSTKELVKELGFNRFDGTSLWLR